jgi:hypothetical protein
MVVEERKRRLQPSEHHTFPLEHHKESVVVSELNFSPFCLAL